MEVIQERTHESDGEDSFEDVDARLNKLRNQYECVPNASAKLIDQMNAEAVRLMEEKA